MLQNLRPIEIIALLAIVVLLFGAKKLPELAKGVGQSLKIFRKEVKDVANPEASDPVGAQPVANSTSAVAPPTHADHPVPSVQPTLGTPTPLGASTAAATVGTDSPVGAAAASGPEGARP